MSFRALVAKWRQKAERNRHAVTAFRDGQAIALNNCASDLEALLSGLEVERKKLEQEWEEQQRTKGDE